MAAVGRFEQYVFGVGQRSASLIAVEMAVARQLATRDPELLIPLLVLHESRYRQSHRAADYQLATHSRTLVAQLSALLLEHADDPSSRRRAADVLTSEAAYLLEIGSTLAARKALGAALDHDPEHPVALFLGATIDEAWGDIDGARRLLETYLELDPTSFEARLRLGISHVRLGNLATAEAFFRDCLGSASQNRAKPSEGLRLGTGEEGPKSWIAAVAHQELGRLLLATGRGSEALALLRQAAEVFPDLPRARIQLVAALDHLGYREEASNLVEGLETPPAVDRATPRLLYSRWALARAGGLRRSLVEHQRAAAPALAVILGTRAPAETAP